MKKIAVALFILTLCSCGLNGDYNSESFIYNLQGVWEKTNDTLYSKIEIEWQYITISGEIANFEIFNILRDIELKGYSTTDSITKDSLIYVYDRGTLKGPIKYSLWTSDKYVQTLTLKGNNVKEEVFIKKEVQNDYQ